MSRVVAGRSGCAPQSNACLGRGRRACIRQRVVPIPCGLLFVFLNGALRLHAAHRAYVANIHETVCDGCAFLGVHRPITAGTSNDSEVRSGGVPYAWAAPWVLG